MGFRVGAMVILMVLWATWMGSGLAADGQDSPSPEQARILARYRHSEPAQRDEPQRTAVLVPGRNLFVVWERSVLSRYSASWLRMNEPSANTCSLTWGPACSRRRVSRWRSSRSRCSRWKYENRCGSSGRGRSRREPASAGCAESCFRLGGGRKRLEIAKS